MLLVVIKEVCMEIKYFGIKPEQVKEDIKQSIADFCDVFSPIEGTVCIFEDNRTNALYCECHICAEKIITLGTIDSPLDSENQAEYRANRDVVEDNTAFVQMKEDAKQKRSFSNIVAEYITSFDEEHPLKIIGGQHRFIAISDAYEVGVDQFHGLKVYFGLNTEQRLDVQLISNTNIAVSTDLLDRMLETVKGPQLRIWCQQVGLLNESEDFADRKQRGGKLTVRAARSFIMNFYAGKLIKSSDFSKIKTIPILAKTGGVDEEWEQLKVSNQELWDDPGLIEAGKQYSKLIKKQREYYLNNAKNQNSDFADKAVSYAVLSAWAFVLGALQDNQVRLGRHYALCSETKTDPLNAKVLAKARHKTDPDNYRGLGTRTDVKDRGRLVELFYFQAEKGSGITKELTNASIMKYHAKLALIEAEEAAKRV